MRILFFGVVEKTLVNLPKPTLCTVVAHSILKAASRAYSAFEVVNLNCPVKLTMTVSRTAEQSIPFF